MKKNQLIQVSLQVIINPYLCRARNTLRVTHYVGFQQRTRYVYSRLKK